MRATDYIRACGPRFLDKEFPGPEMQIVLLRNLVHEAWDVLTTVAIEERDALFGKQAEHVRTLIPRLYSAGREADVFLAGTLFGSKEP